MPEIYQFKIYKADMTLENGSVTARLYYPRNPKILKRRLDENLTFGINVLERLIEKGYSEIANNDNPIGPAGGGSLYVLSDGVFVCHRRDKHAPTHKMYHSVYSGFPDSEEAVYTEHGLIQSGLRETAEECLLITREKIPRLVVPNDSRNHTLASARNLGINLKPLYLDIETLDPRDKLEVYNADGQILFSTRAFLDLVYESLTILNALQIRRVPLSSQEVLPIDGEGIIKNGRFTHLNRESYFINLDEIKNKPFGSLLKNPRVFRTRIKNGIPELFTPFYEKPYLGPDNVEVVSPYVWAPDNLLITCLDALQVSGYKEKKFGIELWKERTKLNGKSLIPKSVRV